MMASSHICGTDEEGHGGVVGDYHTGEDDERQLSPDKDGGKKTPITRVLHHIFT